MTQAAGPEQDAAGPEQDAAGREDLRATRVEIDLDAVQRNVAILASILSPGTELMAVVKANAYGHGAGMVAQAALAAGATRLAVATVGEGRQLRQRGIQAPILVLSPIAAAEASNAIDLGLELAIATEELLAAVTDASRTGAAPVSVHVKLDTGMHRYGAEPALALALAQRVAATPSLRLAGFMTHFATADEADERFTLEQADLFDQCVGELAAQAIRPECRHMANSAAALRNRRYDADLVRFGIALYGLRPSATIALPAGVEPVLTVRSKIGRVHPVGPTTTVGYGRTYTPARVEQVGLVPIGYADGYRRHLSNRSWMMIGDRRAEVIGRVSMDQTVIRLPVGVDVEPGDEVVVFGSSGGGASVDEIANQLGTINYEVVTSLAARIPRHYWRDGRVIAIEGQLPA